MNQPATHVDRDVANIRAWMSNPPDTTTVADFVPGPGIQRLELRFDIHRLRQALDECLARQGFMGSMQAEGFAALPLTKRQPPSSTVSECT